MRKVLTLFLSMMIVCSFVLLEYRSVAGISDKRFCKNGEYEISYLVFGAGGAGSIRYILNENNLAFLSTNSKNIEVGVINLATNRLWKKMIEGYENHSQLYLDEESFLFSVHNKLYCLNPNNGDEIWTKEIPTYYIDEVYNRGDGSFILTCEKKVINFSKKDGSINWEIQLDDFGGRGLLDGNKLVYISNRDFNKHKTKIACYDIGSRQKVWEDEYGSVASPKVISKGKLFYTIDSLLVCANLENGKYIWNIDTHKYSNVFDFRGNYIVFFGSLPEEGNKYFTRIRTRMYFDIETGKFISIDKLAPDQWVDSWEPNFKGDCFFEMFGEYIAYGNPFLDRMYWKYDYSSYKQQYDYVDTTIISDQAVVIEKYDEKNNKTKLEVFLSQASDVISFQVDKKVLQTEKGEKEIDASPAIINGITYLPARYLAEPLGGYIVWNSKTKNVLAGLVKKTVSMTINNPTATINGKKVQIDPKNPKITPIIKDGRTLVPLRFLAENLGCSVKWIAETKTIIVIYQP